MSRDRVLDLATPVAFGLFVVAFWEWAVWFFALEPFFLPAPSAIAAAFAESWRILLPAAWSTLQTTALAFAGSFVLGVGLAILFVESRVLERALYPYAVILQVTPIVSIAPFVLIWSGPDHPDRAVLILAVIVGFFPVLSNAYAGLRGVDANLIDLFKLYGASRWQVLTRLLLPGALPSILTGARIGGGLALVGAVVAEMVAGSGAASGLAWRIVESGNRLEIARMFAGLFLLTALGISIFYGIGWLERRLLGRWHDSVRDAH
jgi:NitT/TauT family transport system permease protein